MSLGLGKLFWVSITIRCSPNFSSIRPRSTIPICLDLGTNTQRYLDDPLYLGSRTRRVGDAEMREFMEEFMYEMHKTFPKLLVQFEVTKYKLSTFECQF